MSNCQPVSGEVLLKNFLTTLPVMPENQSLSNIQLELLKLFCLNLPEEDHLHNKNILEAYFSSKHSRKTVQDSNGDLTVSSPR